MKALQTLTQCLKDAVSVSLLLFRVMIPIIIIVKLLKEFELIHWLALPLEPLMTLVGLPGSMGLVWATGLLNNIYSAMIVFVSLAPQADLSVAQVTVLCTMLLIAHGLPVELKVAQKCGPSMIGQGLIRVLSALACGLVMHLVFSNFDLLEQANVVFWSPGAPPASHLEWALGEVRNLASIFVIIFALMVMMKVLDAIGVTRLINSLLRPILRRIGIGPSASTVTVVGLTLGLSYGSGLIIHETNTGKIAPRDAFYSLTLMGLAHALVEDTMLMLMLGADFNGVFWGRLLFSLVIMALLVQVVSRISDQAFMRLFMRPQKST